MPDRPITFAPSYLLILVLIFAFACCLVWFVRTWLRKPRLPGALRVPAVATAVFLAAVIGYAAATSALDQLTAAFSLWWLAGSVVFAALFQSFKRLIGALSAVLLLALVLVVFLFLQSLTAFTGATKIADVQVLSVDKTGMELRVTPAATAQPDKPTTYRLKGQRLGCIVYHVVFDDVAVFVGTKTRYAWLGMTAFDMGMQQTDLLLFPDAFARMSIFGRMEKEELRLPFVKSVQQTIAIKEAAAGMRYELKMGSTGALLLEPVKK